MARALRLLLSNFGKFSESGPLRERVALALASRGRKREAVQIYEMVARHYANAGYPTYALASIKQMQSLQPDSTELLDHFSSLYNIRSPHLRHDHRAPELPGPSSALDMSAKEPAVGEADLFELAADRALQRRGLSSQPADLPPLPLLSLLPAEALRRVVELLDYEIFAEGQAVMERDEQRADLIWTVSPTLTIREPELQRLPSGCLLGLSGHGHDASRAEVKVFSTRGADILRLSARAMTQLSEEFADFSNRLSTLRRHALTERMMCRHELFTELTIEARAELMERFVGLHLERNERIILQNHPSPGLYIVLEGKVDIMRSDDSVEVQLATLQPGDICGEIGLVSDSPAVASAVMATQGILLFLSREEFSDAAQRHSELARYAVKIARARLEETSSSLSSADLAEEE
jgi:CRP-like cAMP-binding protein